MMVKLEKDYKQIREHMFFLVFLWFFLVFSLFSLGFV